MVGGGIKMCVLRRRKYEKLKFVLVNNGYWNREVFEGCDVCNDNLEHGYRAGLSFKSSHGLALVQEPQSLLCFLVEEALGKCNIILERLSTGFP